MTLSQRLERNVWASTVGIMTMGLIALYSATYGNVRVSHAIFYDQLFFAFLGLATMFVLSHFDYHKFYDLAYVFYIITVVLLVYVLVSGRHILGAKRWIEIGSVNFQPSELAKLAVIVTLARFLSHQGNSWSFRSRSLSHIWLRDLVLCFVIVGAPTLLIFKQPDLGTALLILGIFILMIFVAGIHYRFIFSLGGLFLLVLPFAWHILKPYQRDRLLVFLNPNIDPLGAGYTIIQSKIAVGSGRVFGKGWLAGTQNQLNFLPERHTDFIFSVIGEEWGLLGTLFIVFSFYALIISCLKVTEHTKDEFGRLVAIGIVAILTLQVTINIAMVIGLCPVVGITLPLVSYGRTSFLITCIMLGFILNLNKHRMIF